MCEFMLFISCPLRVELWQIVALLAKPSANRGAAALYNFRFLRSEISRDMSSMRHRRDATPYSEQTAAKGIIGNLETMILNSVFR